MPENQAHGKSWEKDIALNVFKVTEAPSSHTARHDIPGQLNRLDSGVNVSIKTTGSDTICMGDVCRVYENVGNGEPIHMVVIMYSQINDTTKKRERIIEIDLTNSRELLFGTAIIDEINELVAYVKSIPKNVHVSAEHRDTYIRMANDISTRHGGCISYNPKVDSKAQRRVQCSISNFSNFVKEHPERIIAESQTGEFRGGSIMDEIVSTSRKRNNTPRQAEQIRLKKLKADDLKKECSESGLDDKGYKKDLVERLLTNKFGDDDTKKVISIENVIIP